MHLYEACLIFRPALSPEEAEKLAEKLQNLIGEAGGEVSKVDSWGKRKLAYSVEREKEGYYYFLHFSQKPEVISELKRQLRLMPEVLRFMILKMERGGKSA